MRQPQSQSPEQTNKSGSLTSEPEQLVPGSSERLAIYQPLSVRVREACRLTGIGRSKLYELIAAGDIEIVKVGTITLIPVESLRRFLDSCRAG
jgi:excisionase family DNA binding protein